MVTDVLELVAAELGVPYTGDDIAIRMGWITDRGASKGRRYREWVDRGQFPEQLGILLALLAEADLLKPEAKEAWLRNE